MASRKKNASSDDVSVPGSEKSTPKRNKSLNSVTGGSDGETVMVVVRMRPFNKKELGEKRGPCIDMDYKMKQVGITQMMDGEAKGAPNVFTFDSIHGEDTVQIDFYNTACRKLVNSVLSGFNGTIFAYGQTGCGKTWTMQGVLDVPELRGVIPNSFDHIYDHIAEHSSSHFLVRCSYLEIYNEEVRDLLSENTKARLSLKEHPDLGVFVDGLIEEVVGDVDSINAVMERGEGFRTVGSTLMNAGSSRSHSIFTVVVEEFGEGADGKDHLHAGKLNLVDLAGSETTAKTGATGARMKEGVNINKSLSALGNVISALVEGGKGKHVPYRDSKLTRLLQSSLGGNTKTLMMAAISPADYNYNETLSTLRYAARAKNIKNKAKVNEDPKDAMLREYKEEIQRLKDQLAEASGANTPVKAAASAATALSPAATSPGMDESDESDDEDGFPAPPVDAAMKKFLKDEDLGQFADKFARKGVTTVAELTKPWLQNADKFLAQKIGMSPLEMSRFQAALDFHEVQNQSTPLTKIKAKKERMDSRHLDPDENYHLDSLMEDEHEDDMSTVSSSTSSSTKKKPSPRKKTKAQKELEGTDDEEEDEEEEEGGRPLKWPESGDTVKFDVPLASKKLFGGRGAKSLTKKKSVAGTVLERLDDDTLSVWDGTAEVTVHMSTVTAVLKPPPPHRLSSTDLMQSNVEGAQLSDALNQALAKGKAKAGSETESERNVELSPEEALAAQLAAAKAFISQHNSRESSYDNNNGEGGAEEGGERSGSSGRPRPVRNKNKAPSRNPSRFDDDGAGDEEQGQEDEDDSGSVDSTGVRKTAPRRSRTKTGRQDSQDSVDSLDSVDSTGVRKIAPSRRRTSKDGGGRQDSVDSVDLIDSVDSAGVRKTAPSRRRTSKDGGGRQDSVDSVDSVDSAGVRKTAPSRRRTSKDGDGREDSVDSVDSVDSAGVRKTAPSRRRTSKDGGGRQDSMDSIDSVDSAGVRKTAPSRRRTSKDGGGRQDSVDSVDSVDSAGVRKIAPSRKRTTRKAPARNPDRFNEDGGENDNNDDAGGEEDAADAGESKSSRKTAPSRRTRGAGGGRQESTDSVDSVDSTSPGARKTAPSRRRTGASKDMNPEEEGVSGGVDEAEDNGRVDEGEHKGSKSSPPSRKKKVSPRTSVTAKINAFADQWDESEDDEDALQQPPKAPHNKRESATTKINSFADSQWKIESVRASADNDSLAPHHNHEHHLAASLFPTIPRKRSSAGSFLGENEVVDPPKLCNDRNCIVCGDALTRKTRMHCRACGHSVCEACSAGKIPLPQFTGLGEEPQRVCEFCVEAILEQRRGEEWARGAQEAEARAEALKKREQDKMDEDAIMGLGMNISQVDGSFDREGGGNGNAATPTGAKEAAELEGREAGEAMKSANEQQRNSEYTKRAIQQALAEEKKGGGGEEDEEVDLFDPHAAEAAAQVLKERAERIATRKKSADNNKKGPSTAKALRPHTQVGGEGKDDEFATSASVLVDGGTGRSVSFDEILFSGSSTGSGSGSKAETGRLKLKRTKLADEAKKVHAEFKKEKVKARKVALQEKLDKANAAFAEAEKELAAALAAKEQEQLAAAEGAGPGGFVAPGEGKGGGSSAQKPTGQSVSGGLRWDALPRPWERGVSLAVLEKFATEAVVPGSSTEDVCASVRSRIAAAKSVPRTALYGLLRDYGLRTTVTLPVRLVTQDGIEYDAEDGSTEPVELVVSAVGPPNVFVSHAWEADFSDTVAAVVAWCKSAKLDPAAVYVWLDWWCLDQWSEVTSAVVEAGSPPVSEHSVAEAVVYAIRACGNTVCVGSPGFAYPWTLERLWCCAEVYVSVRVGAQCHFAVCPREQATLDQLVYQDLPNLLDRVTHGVNVGAAKCSSNQDRTMLLRWLRGGHPQWGLEPCPSLNFVNRAIASVLRSFLAQAARRIIESRGIGGVKVEDLLMTQPGDSESESESDDDEGGGGGCGGAAVGRKSRESRQKAMEEALLTDKRQVPIMKGYALLLEEHGRCGVGHGRGWSFKMAVIWYLKVLRVYERSSDVSHGGKSSNKSFGRTIVSLLHVAYLLKLQGKREDAIVKFQRIALVFQDVLTKSQGLSGQGASQQHLARSLLGAVRCDIAVLMRDIGRFDDAIAEFKQSRRELHGQQQLQLQQQQSSFDSDGKAAGGGSTAAGLFGKTKKGNKSGHLGGSPNEMLKDSAEALDLVARGGDEGLLFEGLMGMASVRVLQGQHEAALVLFEEALSEQETVLGSGHPSTINTVACIASLRKRLMVGGWSSLASRESTESLPSTLSALEMTLRVYEVVFQVSVVLQVASVLQRCARPKDALRCYARALAEYAADEAKVAEEIDARQRFLEDGTFQGVVSNEKPEVRGGYLHPFGVDSGAGGTGQTGSDGGGGSAAGEEEGGDGEGSVASSKAAGAAAGAAGGGGHHYDLFTLHAARDTGGQYSPLDTAACVNNMAVEFRKLGMLHEAAESFAMALHIKERELGALHPATAKVLNNYGLIRWRMGHVETSLGIFNKLLQLYDTLNETAEAIEGAGGIGAVAGLDDLDFQNAVGFGAVRRLGEMQTSRAILAAGVPPEDVALTLCHIALVHHQLGSLPDAIAFVNRAVLIREQAYEQSSEAWRLADGKASSAAAVAFGGSHKEFQELQQEEQEEAEENDGGKNDDSESRRSSRRSSDGSGRAARASQDPTMLSAAKEAVKAAAACRKCMGSLAGTLYNRGLLNQQAGDLLNSGADLRRALTLSREGFGPDHEYTHDSSGALAFVGRALLQGIGRSQHNNPRHPDYVGAEEGGSVSQSKMATLRFQPGMQPGGSKKGSGSGTRASSTSLASSVDGAGNQTANQAIGRTMGQGMRLEFQQANYEAHRDECLACFESLASHWKIMKGRGHPSAVAAYNAIAEVYKFEVRKDDVVACYSRALREGNARVTGDSGAAGFVDAVTAMGGLSQDQALTSLGVDSTDAVQAAAAADELEARIASLREEKQAAVAREDYQAATGLKQEIVDLQLRMIELEELTSGRAPDVPKGEGKVYGGGSGRRRSSAGKNDKTCAGFMASSTEAGDKKKKAQARLSVKKEEADAAAAAGEEKGEKGQSIHVEESWGSSQKLPSETKLDELVAMNWPTPDEDVAAIGARLETLKGLAVAMFDKAKHEEAAAFHTRVLRLTQRAVVTGAGERQWSRSALVEPLVSLAGAAFTLEHFPQSRTLYEQALQITEKEMGSSSPDTASAINDLAIVVRELGEDQEALQLHARAIRIRQKTVGVWNVLVAEALYNVSLIYRDLNQLDSSAQVSRGCCRVYGAVLGESHPDSREAEDLLKEISSELYRHGANGSGSGLWACLVGTPPHSSSHLTDAQEDAEDLKKAKGKSGLRMAFRTVLEEVSRGAPTQQASNANQRQPSSSSFNGSSSNAGNALGSQPSGSFTPARGHQGYQGGRFRESLESLGKKGSSSNPKPHASKQQQQQNKNTVGSLSATLEASDQERMRNVATTTAGDDSWANAIANRTGQLKNGYNPAMKSTLNN